MRRSQWALNMRPTPVRKSQTQVAFSWLDSLLPLIHKDANPSFSTNVQPAREEMLVLRLLLVPLLDFGRERCDLGQLVAEVVEQMQATAPAHRLHRYGDDDAFVEADRDRLGRKLALGLWCSANTAHQGA